MPLPLAVPPRFGVALYLTGVFLFALNDALGKWLVKDYGVGQLMMLRSLGAVVVLAPMAMRLGSEILDFRQGGLMALRVVVTALDTFAFYWATRFLPLADVMTFYMAPPLIATALSALLLGERVEPFRWAAIAVGFVGVVIALRPTPGLFTWASFISLMGAGMFALGQTITRRMRQTHWLPIVFWQFLGGGLIGAATMPLAWSTPSALRSRADVRGRRRLDVLLHLHRARARGDPRRRARALAIFSRSSGRR